MGEKATFWVLRYEAATYVAEVAHKLVEYWHCVMLWSTGNSICCIFTNLMFVCCKWYIIHINVFTNFGDVFEIKPYLSIINLVFVNFLLGQRFILCNKMSFAQRLLTGGCAPFCCGAPHCSTAWAAHEAILTSSSDITASILWFYFKTHPTLPLDILWLSNWDICNL